MISLTRSSDPKPQTTPAPDVDPDTGTEPDGTPVENPSGFTEPAANVLLAA